MTCRLTEEQDFVLHLVFCFCLFLAGYKNTIFWTILVVMQILFLKSMAAEIMQYNALNYNSDEILSFNSGNYIKQLLAVCILLYMIEKDRLRAQLEQAQALENQKKIAQEQLKSQDELENTTKTLKTAFELISDQSNELNTRYVELNKSRNFI
jgi:hypothetical protein